MSAPRVIHRGPEPGAAGDPGPGAGPGRAPDLVLVHGWAMHAQAWGRFSDRLAAGRTLHLVNLPGHGGSPHVPGWDADRLARELLAGPLADVAAADWLGWSLGGQVALAAARQAPHRVRRLFLIGFNPCFVSREGWPGGQQPGFFRDFRRACARDPAGTMEQFLGLQLLDSERARPTLRSLRAIHRSATPPGREALLHGLDLLAGTDQVADLESIGTPTLWLCGERDALTPPGAHRRAAALMDRAAVELVPGAGHAPFLSHEQAVIGHLQAFRPGSLAA